MTPDQKISMLITLLVVVDPIGIAPIFVSLTEGMLTAQRRHVAWLSSAIATIILIFFALLGARLLASLGIGLPAMQISGGLLLFWIAFEMVFDLREDRKQSVAEEAKRHDQVRNIAAFPLAIPSMAGPGAITAVILLAGRAENSMPQLAVLLAFIALTMAACWATFLMADRVAAALGSTGRIVLTRLLGMILTALAVQFVVDGVRDLLRTPL